MNHGPVPAVLAALLLATCAAAAQPPADFSGTWTLAPSGLAAGAATGSTPPTLSAHGDMGSGWGSEITITQDASVLMVSYTYFHPRDIQPALVFRYRLDGASATNTVNMGRGPQDQVSRTSWQGTSLVIRTEHRFVNPRDGRPLTSETKQVLSLESPTVLAIETTRSAVLGGRASTTRTLYNRR
jgi:hypothetical protein